jgi:serine/threonine protein kinase
VSEDPDNLTDSVVGGFRLGEVIGKGGMGRVYRAIAPDQSAVAVKVLAGKLNDDRVQRARFYQEAEMAMRLDHPNICRGLKVGEDAGRHFFAMELVEGESLTRQIKRSGRYSPARAVELASQLAEAVHRAHREGMIHRDIKPDNALVTYDGVVKLIDLGLAKDLEGDLNLTKTGRGLGTPQFMAPEQFKNAKHADVRCDVYSLGATLYAMVTGELPFKGKNPMETFMKKSENKFTPARELVPDLPDAVATAIDAAMDANPKRRPGSARAFARLMRGEISAEIASRAAAPSGARPGQESDTGSPVWFVVLEDEAGKSQKVRAPESTLISMIKRGKVGLGSTGSRERQGPFTPLADQPVFREHFDGIETVDRSDPESGGVSGLLDLDTQPDDGDTRADGGRAGRTPGGNRPAWLIPAIIGGVVLVVIVIAATLFRGS